MTIDELIANFEASEWNYTDEIIVEVDGVPHAIQLAKGTPLGFTLVVDSFEEDRAARQVLLEDLEDCHE